MPKKSNRDQEIQDRKDERKRSSRKTRGDEEEPKDVPAAAASAVEKDEDDREEDDQGQQRQGKKQGKKKRDQKKQGDDDAEVPEEEVTSTTTKPKKMVRSEVASATVSTNSGSSSTTTSGLQNASIIVSAGGSTGRKRRQKWPDYVFLKGTGFSARGAQANAKDIKISDFSLQVPGKVLLKSASLTLAFGRKYGLMGRNGIGKSVLLRAISTRDPASPFGKVPANIRILHVQQEVTGDDRVPLETVLAADIERSWLLAEVERLTAAEAARRASSTHAEDEDSDGEDEDEEVEGYGISDLHERLRDIDAHKAVPRAMMILAGLGFSDDEIKNKPTKSFSGGWRMRIALAQALFLMPELLILDEPTNHLDMSAVFWLEAYLAKWKKTLLLVSHDATFVASTCTNIVHFHDLTLTQYKGDYASFLKAREQQVSAKSRQLHKQDIREKKAQEMKSTKKSGNAGKQQSRQLNELQSHERVEEEVEEAIPAISFPEPGQLGLPVLQLQEVAFGYEAGKPPLFKRLDFGLYLDSRIGLVGPNGTGKSTLMKLMSGELKEIKGYVQRNPHLVMARFHQHHLDQLNMDITPIEYMQAKFPTAQTQDVRQFIGRFGVKGSMALQKIGTLSGGQRSRLVFAELCYKTPHLLLLDEPTNHLDADTIEALIDALREFKGGVVLISHHQRLIEAACKEVWVIQKGSLERFDGDFADYKKMIVSQMPSVGDDDDDDN